MTEPPRYDLFISHADADRAWVEDLLLPSLREAGLRCHTEAAFALGKPRLLEFERAVRQSRRTLLVLSPAYLADGFSQFADVLAQSCGGESADWPAIPLVLQQVELPSRLQMLTKLDATDPGRWPGVVERLVDELRSPEDGAGRVREERRAVLGPRQIRAPAPDFVGRAEDLAALLAGFERGATICGISGQGGVGKTELALKLAQLVGDRYLDGHVFLDLRGFDRDRAPLTRRDVLAHVIQSFRPQERLPDGDDALEGLYHSLLAGKRILLLLDNAAGPEQLRNLLPPLGCVLLVTSRRRFTLPGLPPHDLDALPLPEAVSLLRSLASRVTLAEAEEPAVLCGRLPLALRFAGSLLAERDNLSPARYLERLRAARLAERTGLSEVAASTRLSEETLPEPLRTKWRELAVVAGGFELSWAAAVWGVDGNAADDDLGVLRKNSLLDWEAEERLYRMHDLMREYAATRRDQTARDAAARRHAAYFCGAVCAADDELKRGGAAIHEALRRFDRLWTDAQIGFTWVAARTRGDADLARLCVGYANGSANIRALRQHPRDQIVWGERAATAAREVGDRRGEGLALDSLGIAYTYLGQPQRAIGYFEQPLAIARQVGDRRGEGAALGNLGVAYASLGQPQRAIDYYEQNLAITRRIGDRRGEGNTLGNPGNAYADLGQPQRAIDHYQQQLTIAREIGDRRGEGYARWNWGEALVKPGRVADAIPLMEVRVAFENEIGHPDAEESAAQLEELRRSLARTPDS